MLWAPQSPIHPTGREEEGWHGGAKGWHAARGPYRQILGVIRSPALALEHPAVQLKVCGGPASEKPVPPKCARGRGDGVVGVEASVCGVPSYMHRRRNEVVICNKAKPPCGYANVPLQVAHL